MRKGNKRMWAAFMAAAMAMTGLAGCGQAADQTGSVTESAVQTAAAADGTELKTIRILGIDNSGTDDSGNTVYLSDWLNGDSRMWERLTSDLAEYGVALELDLIPSDQYETVVQTQIAAGLDCDMVNITSVDAKTRMNLVKQGKLVAVNEIWEQYSDEATKAYYTSGGGSEVARLNILEDGNQYWLSACTIGDYNGEAWGGFTGPMIRQDWLNKLGLDMPKTTEELFNVLSEFQKQDANGNGQADEVVTVDLETFGNGMALMFGLGTDSYIVDYETGKATSPWYQEGIKDYVTYMNRLCEAGLLDTSGQGSEKKAENKVSLINGWWISTWDEPGVIVGEGEAAPYFVGLLCDPGNGITPLVDRQNAIQKGNYEFAVTSNADPEAIGRLLDYLASDAYSTLSEFGIEGYTYEVVDGVKKKLPTNEISEVQIMSKLPALWVNDGILPRVEVTDRAQELITCEEAGYTMGYPETGFKEKVQVIRDVYEHPENYKFAIMNTEGNLAIATEEETERIADLKADFDTYSKELLTRLILGQASLDDWDTYMAELKELGLDELIEITQARYNRAHQ